MGNKSIQVGIRMDEEMHEIIKKMAKEIDRPVGWLIRDIIKKAIK